MIPDEILNNTPPAEEKSRLAMVREYVNQHILLILVGIVIISSGTALYFYNQYSGLIRDPNKISQDEAAKLIALVGKLIVLPEGETPTTATVSDPEKLRSQPFFAKAKRGDRVLIYANSKKAILYDPGINKIVEVTPINVGSSNPVLR